MVPSIFHTIPSNTKNNFFFIIHHNKNAHIHLLAKWNVRTFTYCPKSSKCRHDTLEPITITSSSSACWAVITA